MPRTSRGHGEIHTREGTMPKDKDKKKDDDVAKDEEDKVVRKRHPFSGVLEKMCEDFEMKKELGLIDSDDGKLKLSEPVRHRDTGDIYVVTLELVKEAETATA